MSLFHIILAPLRYLRHCVLSVYELLPLFHLYRQARSRLAPPTASFAGKTVLLTGATGGIGAETARILADLGVERLILGVLNVATEMEAARRLAAELGRRRGPGPRGAHEPGGQPEVSPGEGPGVSDMAMARPEVVILELDLASFASVRAFATQVEALAGRLDVAVMAAGKLSKKKRLTTDGWEEVLQIQHLSTALLELLLIPQLIRSAKTYGNISVLTSVSSFGIGPASPLLRPPRASPSTAASRPTPLLSGLSGVRNTNLSQQYGRTKLLHLHFLRRLADEIPDEHRTLLEIHSVDPGATNTPMTRINKSARLLGMLLFRPMVMCARTIVNACLVNGVSGARMIDYDIVPYPSYMNSQSGQRIARAAWEETIAVLESMEGTQWLRQSAASPSKSRGKASTSVTTGGLDESALRHRR